MSALKTTPEGRAKLRRIIDRYEINRCAIVREVAEVIGATCPLLDDVDTLTARLAEAKTQHSLANEAFTAERRIREHAEEQLAAECRERARVEAQLAHERAKVERMRQLVSEAIELGCDAAEPFEKVMRRVDAALAEVRK